MISTFEDKDECTIVAASSKNSLDIIEAMLETVSYEVFRIDGKASSVKQLVYQRFVSQLLQLFNYFFSFDSCPITNKVFLLHTGTSTCGYSIKTASKLILFDVESWSAELNVKDRVWRDVEIKECEIYRLVTEVGFFLEA